MTNFRTGNDSYGEYISGDGFGVINQTVWDSQKKGSIMLRFYAKDNLGYISYKEVIVIKGVDPIIDPLEPITDGSNQGISGYCIIVVIGSIGIGLIIMKRRLKIKF